MASWPPGLRPDPVGGAGVVRPGDEGVVRALPVRPPDRAHRRDVDDVESHLGDRRQALRGRAEGAGGPGAVVVTDGALGPGEELVPGAVAGAKPFDAQCAGRAGGGQARDRRDRDGVRHPPLGDDAPPGARVGAGVPQRGGRVAEQRGCVVPARVLLRGALEQPGALLEHEFHVDAGGDLDAGVVQPGAPVVAPGVHVPGPRADLVDLHGGGPPSEARVHLHHRPGDGTAGRCREHHRGADHVVALFEHGRRERHDLAREGLRGPQVVGLLRREIQDRDPAEHRLPRDRLAGGLAALRRAGARSPRPTRRGPCRARRLDAGLRCLGVSHVHTLREPIGSRMGGFRGSAPPRPGECTPRRKRLHPPDPDAVI